MTQTLTNDEDEAMYPTTAGALRWACALEGQILSGLDLRPRSKRMICTSVDLLRRTKADTRTKPNHYLFFFFCANCSIYIFIQDKFRLVPEI